MWVCPVCCEGGGVEGVSSGSGVHTACLVFRRCLGS